MSKSKSTKQQSGFTLIEILVVVSVIGFISSSVMVALNTARTKAANTRRVAEFKTGIKALESYRIDNGGFPFPEFPSSAGTSWVCWGYSTESCMRNFTTGDDAIVNALLPYMDRPPQTGVLETSSYGQNRIAGYIEVAVDGRKTLNLFWPYDGNMPPDLCPLMPGGRILRLTPPGYWSAFGDDTNYSYCWEKLDY